MRLIMNIDYGKNIRKVRKYLKLNQFKFAQKIDVEQPTVSCWERNKTHPTPDKVGIIIERAKKVGLYFTPEEIAPI
jgi:transcriptional regulator with XRE-family HTH domain